MFYNQHTTRPNTRMFGDRFRTKNDGCTDVCFFVKSPPIRLFRVLIRRGVVGIFGRENFKLLHQDELDAIHASLKEQGYVLENDDDR